MDQEQYYISAHCTVSFKPRIAPFLLIIAPDQPRKLLIMPGKARWFLCICKKMVFYCSLCLYFLALLIYWHVLYFFIVLNIYFVSEYSLGKMDTTSIANVSIGTASKMSFGASNALLAPGAAAVASLLSPYDNVSISQSLEESCTFEDLEFAGPNSANTSRASSRNSRTFDGRMDDATVFSPARTYKQQGSMRQAKNFRYLHALSGFTRKTVWLWFCSSCYSLRPESCSVNYCREASGTTAGPPMRPRSAKSVDDATADARRVSALSNTSG